MWFQSYRHFGCKCAWSQETPEGVCLWLQSPEPQLEPQLLEGSQEGVPGEDTPTLETPGDSQALLLPLLPHPQGSCVPAGTAPAPCGHEGDRDSQGCEVFGGCGS